LSKKGNYAGQRKRVCIAKGNQIRASMSDGRGKANVEEKKGGKKGTRWGDGGRFVSFPGVLPGEKKSEDPFYEGIQKGEVEISPLTDKKEKGAVLGCQGKRKFKKRTILTREGNVGRECLKKERGTQRGFIKGNRQKPRKPPRIAIDRPKEGQPGEKIHRAGCLFTPSTKKRGQNPTLANPSWRKGTNPTCSEGGISMENEKCPVDVVKKLT